MGKKINIGFLVVAFALCVSSLVYGDSPDIANLNAVYPANTNPGNISCATCHPGGSGSAPALTPYGTAYVAAGRSQAALRTIGAPGGGTDTTPPTVSVFTIPATAASLTVSFTTLTATDNVGITGYMVNESSTKPSATATGWTATKPTSYSFVSAGAKTLYAWAKDAAGNVSGSKSANVQVSAPAPSLDMTAWVGKWFKVTERITGFQTDASSLRADTHSFAAYMKIWGWDPSTNELQVDRYEADPQTGQWVSETLTLHYIAGKVLNFICWYQNTTSTETLGFVVRFLGTQKSGVLTTGQMKTFGGYYVDTDNNAPELMDYYAGKLAIIGQIVSEAAVPVPSGTVLH